MSYVAYCFTHTSIVFFYAKRIVNVIASAISLNSNAFCCVPRVNVSAKENELPVVLFLFLALASPPPPPMACVHAHARVHAKLLWLCPVLCNPVDCSLPGSPVHGILQARILEWVAISSSRGGLPNPGIKPMFPASPVLAGRFFTTVPSGKPSY